MLPGLSPYKIDIRQVVQLDAGLLQALENLGLRQAEARAAVGAHIFRYTKQ